MFQCDELCVKNTGGFFSKAYSLGAARGIPILEVGATPTIAQAQVRHSDPRNHLVYGHVNAG
jgi:hypothetical protein